MPGFNDFCLLDERHFSQKFFENIHEGVGNRYPPAAHEAGGTTGRAVGQNRQDEEYLDGRDRSCKIVRAPVDQSSKLIIGIIANECRFSEAAMYPPRSGKSPVDRRLYETLSYPGTLRSKRDLWLGAEARHHPEAEQYKQRVLPYWWD